MADVPAYKTKKFWAHVFLTLVGLLVASGVALPALVAKVIGTVTTVLALLGFRSAPAAE